MRTLVVITAIAIASGCRSGTDAPTSVDLIELLPSAERRAGGNVDDAVRAISLRIEGTETPGLILRAPARVTWTIRIPEDAVLATTAALVPEPEGTTGAGATLRVGLSDNRFYEGVFELRVQPSLPWQPVTVDLRKYAGWQWSLFYRPSSIPWKLIVNADATPGGTIALHRPAVRSR